MNLLEVDDNNYTFVTQDIVEQKYRHKYLVPGTETKDLGMTEKWSDWTKKDARAFAFANDVDVVQSRSKKV